MQVVKMSLVSLLKMIDQPKTCRGCFECQPATNQEGAMRRSRSVRRFMILILLVILCVTIWQVYESGIRYGSHGNREDYFERVVMAIYEIEGADKARVPFGIGSVKCADYSDCKQVAYNTVKNNWNRWESAGQPGTYSECLAKRYCPYQWRWWARALDGRLK